uniref:Uncharacterized protein n=1 Tax=Candidatus Kentrum sp. FW TaxID=2126338 RepID=A0A450TTV2_9GAMM|nr:MAG: hypothetical protein BECKFW1821C_GA0114237_103017 [Candidatus Kentron sp. FW]
MGFMADGTDTPPKSVGGRESRSELFYAGFQPAAWKSSVCFGHTLLGARRLGSCPQGAREQENIRAAFPHQAALERFRFTMRQNMETCWCFRSKKSSKNPT